MKAREGCAGIYCGCPASTSLNSFCRVQEADVIILLDSSNRPRMLGEGAYGQVRRQKALRIIICCGVLVLQNLVVGGVATRKVLHGWGIGEATAIAQYAREPMSGSAADARCARSGSAANAQCARDCVRGSDHCTRCKGLCEWVCGHCTTCKGILCVHGHCTSFQGTYDWAHGHCTMCKGTWERVHGRCFQEAQSFCLAQLARCASCCAWVFACACSQPKTASVMQPTCAAKLSTR